MTQLLSCMARAAVLCATLAMTTVSAMAQGSKTQDALVIEKEGSLDRKSVG